MPINITDELHAATTKGKIASAKEVFLTGDTENLQQIGEKTHQLEDSIKNIAATGGASTAAAVTFDNAASGMTAVNAQGAIEELNTKNKTQDTEISKKANTADVTSQIQTEQERVNTELGKKANTADVNTKISEEKARVDGELNKKFAKTDIVQELGESEEKVVSQKCVKNKFDMVDLNIKDTESKIGIINGEVQCYVTQGSGALFSSGSYNETKTDYGISNKFNVKKGDKLIYDILTASTYAIACKSKYNSAGDFLGYIPLIVAEGATLNARTSGEYTFNEDCEVTLCCYTYDEAEYMFKHIALDKQITNRFNVINASIEGNKKSITDIENTVLGRLPIDVNRGSGVLFSSGSYNETKNKWGISDKFNVKTGDKLLYDVLTSSDSSIACKSKYDDGGNFLGYLPLIVVKDATLDKRTKGEYVFSEDCEVTLCCYTYESAEYSFVVAYNGKSIEEQVKSINDSLQEKADKKAIGSLYVIGDLISNFNSPFACKITGSAGSPNAKYEFSVPIKSKFNIRFKFRITENIYNTLKSCNIVEINGKSIIRATPVAMSQITEDYNEENGESGTSFWPAMTGGIRFFDSYKFDDDNSSITTANISNIGDYAFSIKYTGTQTDNIQVKIMSDGFYIMRDGVVTKFGFDDYPTVESLYSKLKSLDYIDVDYNEIENRNSSELAVFPYMRLTSRYHRSISGGSQGIGEVVYYNDAAPLHISYAVSDRWHQAEITEYNGKYYSCVDGFFEEVSIDINNMSQIILGGDCGVLFKDVEIDTDTPRDAEVRDYVWTVVSGGSQKKNVAFVSSVCPYIALFEVHGMIEGSSGEATQSEKTDIQCSADRIEYIHSILHSNGYLPVSMKDICDFMLGHKELPKFCYSFMFDDWRWDNFLNLKKRSVFTRNGLKSSLAIITNGSAQSITYNDKEITKDKAISIGENCGFSFYSHTYNHRKVDCRKPSEMNNEFLQDIYLGDEFGINPSIIIYPNGRNNAYSRNTMKFLGFLGGVTVPRKYTIRKCTNRFSIPRIYLELNQTIDTVLGELILTTK